MFARFIDDREIEKILPNVDSHDRPARCGLKEFDHRYRPPSFWLSPKVRSAASQPRPYRSHRILPNGKSEIVMIVERFHQPSQDLAAHPSIASVNQ